ncbi:MAG: ABC transporter substrate-binding protein [Oscillochloris sp.]|nr:ABC transporter substrate-binding protein [Oscillochloris sp.]
MALHATSPLGRAIALVTLLCMITLASACSAPPATPSAQPAPTELGVQLSWVHEYSSSPFYAAAKNGHFAAEGLQVRFEEGGFNSAGYIDPISQVLDGNADIGMTSSSSLIAARAAGKPVIGIGNIFQRSPLAIISLAEQNILRPQDLVGRTVLVAQDGANDSLLAMLKIQQIDPDTITILPRTSFGVDPLLNGEADAIVAWIINEGVQVREAGREPNIMLMSDYGIDTYDFVIFTSEQALQERPEQIERFMRALNHGIADVIANPEQAISYTLEFNPDLDQAGQLQRLAASLPLIRPANTQIGTFDIEIWELTQQLLLEGDRIDAPIDLERAFTKAFVSAEETE